ncbi:hypothetical protein ACJDT4_12395 [Clostridium neuense]|uniref:Uncharacterized protein n=1 Tax=Clostridium neuense TaxID=1728934 RepID=A0ABW8THF9_9CLOT
MKLKKNHKICLLLAGVLLTISIFALPNCTKNLGEVGGGFMSKDAPIVLKVLP